jgi:alkanesulfonate monooxygenase SsuD/methylene tetrahydromethanopterin reductase-like flavin-dependent oxidoreductase (luciferase family)
MRSHAEIHLAFTLIDDDWERARADAARHLARRYDQPFDELAKKYCVLGSAAQCVDSLGRFVAAGVRTFVIAFTAAPGRVAGQFERFAAEVIPQLRGAGRGAGVAGRPPSGSCPS